MGKADLELTPADETAADAAHAGWRPRGWSVDEAARIAALLAFHEGAGANRGFAEVFKDLRRTSDMAEMIALYRGLPLYPDQPRYVLRAAEGIRTNMKAVFEAVAHRNPYPSEQLSEPAWNQMVLKTLFIDSTLHSIAGLDRRANPTLARMLCDYAHERWAAGRPVTPELWRCVGPHVRGEMLHDLERVLEKGTDPEREAAALALASSPDPAAADLLKAYPQLSDAVKQSGQVPKQYGRALNCPD